LLGSFTLQVKASQNFLFLRAQAVKPFTKDFGSLFGLKNALRIRPVVRSSLNNRVEYLIVGAKALGFELLVPGGPLQDDVQVARESCRGL
jgi:hypothetical protein